MEKIKINSVLNTNDFNENTSMFDFKKKIAKKLNNNTRCSFIKINKNDKEYFFRCKNNSSFNSKFSKFNKFCEEHKIISKDEALFKICQFPNCEEKVQANKGFIFCHSHDSAENRAKRRFELNGKKNVCIHCNLQEEHVTRRSNFACRYCYPLYNKCYIKGCENSGNYYKRQGLCKNHGILTTLQKEALKSGKLLNIIKTLD